MDKFKIFIIILLGIILILILSIFAVKFVNKNMIFNIDEGGEIDISLKKQQSPNIYFSVERYLKAFFTKISNQDKEQVYHLLHEDYINENKITIDNVLEKMIKIKDVKEFLVDEMYVKEAEDAYSNYVKGTLIYQDNEYIWYGLVEVNNGSYAIYPFSEKDYSEIIKENKIIERKKLKINEYNEFFSANFSKEKLCYRYFEDYINKLLNKPNIAFDLLDSEYKSKRFEDNEELFKKYIEDRRAQLKNAVLIAYSYNYDGYNLESIILEDNFDNYYIIKENAILDYTIKLDNYTIKNEKFYEEYEKTKDADKVAVNVKETVKMLNSKDYKQLYNKLYDQFKNNYFQDENKFKQYMINTYYDYNIIDIKSIEKENGDIYVCKVVLKDGASSAAETKNMTIMMRLIDNNDYVLSFTI